MGFFDGIKRWAQHRSDRTTEPRPVVQLRRRGETSIDVRRVGSVEQRHIEVVFPSALSDPDQPFVLGNAISGLLDDAWIDDPDTTAETSETVENGLVTRTTVYRSGDGSRVVRRIDRQTEGADAALADLLSTFRERYPDAVIDGDHVEIDLDLDAPTDDVVDEMQALAREMLDHARVRIEQDGAFDDPATPTSTMPPPPPPPSTATAPARDEPAAAPISLDEADVLAAVFDGAVPAHERRNTVVPRYLGETITWSVEVETIGRAGSGSRIEALIGHVGDSGRYSDRVRGEILTAAPADVHRGDEVTVQAVIGAIDVYSRRIELLDAEVVSTGGH